MTVNFSRQTSQVGFQITVPEGFRKSTNKIKIPAFPGYRIIRMIDEGFQEQRDSWRRDGDYFILDAKNLPSSERYLIELEGRVSEKVLKDFVYIKPAVNRDSYSDADKYWLDTSIKKVGALERVYEDLEIEEVNFGVRIDVEKMFGLAIPGDLKERAEAQKIYS